MIMIKYMSNISIVDLTILTFEPSCRRWQTPSPAHTAFCVRVAREAMQQGFQRAKQTIVGMRPQSALLLVEGYPRIPL